MDFSLTDDQVRLMESVSDFAARELNSDLRTRDRLGIFPRKEWEACARFGILGLPISKEYGGTGSDILTTTLMMEGLGYGCRDNGLIFSLNAQMWSIEMPLANFGTTEQKKEYLPALVSGEKIGVHAMTEAQSGSDAFSLSTRARKDGSNFVLDGSKLYITNAPVADVVLVYARVGETQGFAGVSAFLVDKGTTGFDVGKPLEKMGLRTSPMGEVILNNCKVPEEKMLGRVGSGLALFNSSMEWERAGILASAVGTMKRQLEACIAYAKSRKQFGQPIGKFESVSNKISDMQVRLETARLLIYKVAWLEQHGRPAGAEAAVAKVYTSEAWVQSCLDAIQIHGAFGYMTDTEIERDLRDSVAGTIYSGTSEIQRLIIARELGL